MELSRTYSPGFPITRFHRSSLLGNSNNNSNIRTILVPKIIISCVPKRCSQSQHLYSHQNNSNLFHQPKIYSFGADLSYEGKTFPLLKATEHRIGAIKSDSLLGFFDILMRFMKPHILYGTIVAFIGIMIRTWMENGHLIMLPKWFLFSRAIVVLLTLICTDGFVSGINQIYDIDIDRVNKPHYPLVSGELSLQFAWIITMIYIAIPIIASIFIKSSSLLGFVLCVLILGSLYSVPPFSTKRSTIGACLTMSLMRCNYVIGLSSAARTILGLPFQLSTSVIFLAIFASLFTLASSALKDIEDLEGDKKYDVPTLASKYGPRKVAAFGFGFILHIYGGAIATAIFMPQVFKQSIMIPAHIFLALCLIFEAWKLEKANYTKEAGLSMYQSIVKLFNAEFLLFPFI